MKKIGRDGRSRISQWLCMLLCLCMVGAVLPGIAAFADGSSTITESSTVSSYVALAEDVTADMLQAETWVGGEEYEEVLLTPEEIQAFNAENFASDATKMTVLSEEKESFNGFDLREQLAGFEVPQNLFLDNEPVPADYYEAIRANIAGADVRLFMQVGYGIVINRTVMKKLPYDDAFLADETNDPEWDNLAYSAMQVNEPVLTYITTKDGRFTYIKGEIYGGWVPTEDIALCHDREEWLTAQKHENFLVVTGESVTTEASAANAFHSERNFDMGTVLELAEADGLVDNRSTLYNYVVLIPGRGEDGLYEAQKGLISVNRDVHVGYLPLTRQNIVRQAIKCLGNRYGWSGTLDSQDCSSYVREVYLCFGMKLARNTTWQAAMPVRVIDVKESTVEEKVQELEQAGPGAIVQIPGHEMIYLGTDTNGKHYVINDASSTYWPEDGTLTKFRMRSVIINAMENVYKSDGNTWIEDMTKIIIPWQK